MSAKRNTLPPLVRVFSDACNDGNAKLINMVIEGLGQEYVLLSGDQIECIILARDMWFVKCAKKHTTIRCKYMRVMPKDSGKREEHKPATVVDMTEVFKPALDRLERNNQALREAHNEAKFGEEIVEQLRARVAMLLQRMTPCDRDDIKVNLNNATLLTEAVNTCSDIDQWRKVHPSVPAERHNKPRYAYTSPYACHKTDMIAHLVDRHCLRDGSHNELLRLLQDEVNALHKCIV